MRSYAPKKLCVIPDLALMSGLFLLTIVVLAGIVPRGGRQLPLSFPPVTLKVATQALPPDQVVVIARADGLIVNGEPVPEKGLADALGSLLAGRTAPVVVLDADPDLPYERVVFLMDAFHRAGARAVGLAPDLSEFLKDATGLEPPGTPGISAPPPANHLASPTEVTP